MTFRHAISDPYTAMAALRPPWMRHTEEPSGPLVSSSGSAASHLTPPTPFLQDNALSACFPNRTSSSASPRWAARTIQPCC